MIEEDSTTNKSMDIKEVEVMAISKPTSTNLFSNVGMLTLVPVALMSALIFIWSGFAVMGDTWMQDTNLQGAFFTVTPVSVFNYSQ